MNSFNINNIPADIINTFEISGDAWGIKDKNSCFVYANNTFKNIQSLKDPFSYEGLYDDEIPWEGARFHKEFILHDKTVMDRRQSITSLETHKYFNDNHLSSYLFEKIPFYGDNNECQGIIFYGRKAESYCLNRLYRGKLPGSLMFTPPVDTLSTREWDIVFLFIHRYTSKQIGKILNISYRTVENHFAAIYRKIGIHKSSQFLEYCYEHDFDLYVPEHFVKAGSRLLFK
nr:LuxR C-terminal-related transcriptional regulator [uncultured Moellerella sp.]